MAEIIDQRPGTLCRPRDSLGFQRYDKAVGCFRVTVLDQNLEEVAYMKGANSDDTTLDVGFNIKAFLDPVLREMFQMD